MVYALIALGYTMVYGILRMINFSHGEVFMVGGFVGWWVISGLLASGLGLPAPLVVLLALAAAIVLCGGLGYAIERIAYRPLRNSRSMGAIISGLGVSIFLQTAAILVFGARPRVIETWKLIPNGWTLTLGPVTVSFVRVLVAFLALGLMVALEAFVLRTKWGRATRATAQDLEAATFMGIDVDRVVSMVYVIGSALAGVGGVLIGLLYTQVDFAFGFFIGIKAFTAAVIGGIGNVRGALLGGLVLGVTEAVATGFLSSAYRDIITFALLVGVLLVRPAGLLGRPLRRREAVAVSMPARRHGPALGRLLEAAAAPLDRLATWGRPRRWVVTGLGGLGAVAILAVPRLIDSAYAIRVLGAAGLAVVLTASLNVVAGYAGLLSLGHIGFYALGAYLYAFLASSQFGLHLAFPLVLLASGTVAAGVGLLIGWPSLRLRGDYLAMVTLAFAEIVRNLALSLDRPIDITGGVNGILGLDPPRLAGVEIRELPGFYYLIWVFAFFCLGLIGRLRRSRVGRAWLAIREDEVAAGSAGVPVFRYKMLAFAVSAIGAALAGAVFAAWQGSVFPDSFTIQQTAILYAMLVVSGAAGLPGIVAGALLLTVVPEWLRDYGIYRMLVFGALLVLVMRWRPQGFFAAVPRRVPDPSLAAASAAPASLG
jgi:branched-chain amino acid transport system permease protein